MKKQIVILMAAIMMIATMATACGGGGSSAPAEQSGSQPAAQSSADNAEEAPAAVQDGPVSAEHEFPIVQEKIELTVMAPNQANVDDFTTNTFTTYYEDLTNIRINWIVVPSDSLTDRVNISLSSGDMPDIYLSCAISQSQQLVYGGQGAFQALNPYIDKYGSYFKSIMQSIPNLESVLTMSDGNIYALPYIEKCPHCEVSNKMWVNRDWLNALGIAEPTTTDEFVEMLRAFKNDDPNGNGLQDEVPLLTFEKGWNTGPMTGPLMNPFVYTSPDKFTYLDNGKVLSAYSQDGWRDAMSWIHSLYAEGLYYDQSLVSNQDQARRVAQSGQDGAAIVGVFLGGVPSSVPGDLPEQWTPYKVLPPLQGPAGRFATWGGYSQSDPTKFVITSTCENPEAAFRWGVEQYTKDISYQRTFGVEGESWEKITPGQGDIPADAVDLRTGTPSEILMYIDGVTWGDPQNNCWRHVGLRCDSPDFTDNRYAQFEPGDYETNMEVRLSYDTRDYMEPYRPDISVVLPPLVYTEDQALTVANNESVILAYVAEMGARFITGDTDVNAEWDSYLAELDNKGLSQLMEVYQQAYDAKYGS